MDITQLQSLLADMPLADEVKKEIVDRQAAGDAHEKILDLIESKLKEVKQGVLNEDPDLATEYAKLEEDYSKEVVAAADDFDKEMAAIQADAKVLDQEVNKSMDEARMVQLKQEQEEITK